MRNPVIPAIAVVFDDKQSSAVLQVTTHEREHRALLIDEVERVRHHDTVEVREIEPSREVGILDAQLGLRHRRDEPAPQLRECGTIAIDRVDDAVRTDEIGEGERERARSRAQVCPRAAFALGDAASEKSDVVRVVHGEPSSLSRQPSVESARVTGPSASRRTSIVAPNRP